MGTNRKQIVQRFIISLFMLSCLFVCTTPVQAENVTDWLDEDEQEQKDDKIEEPVEIAPIETNEPSLLWSAVKLIFILALMIGLLYVGVRFFSRRNRQMRDLNILENLGGIPVGQQKSVQLIRLGSTYYLLGVGESVELLKEIEDESMIEELQHLAEAPQEENWFAAFQRKQKEKNEPKESNAFKQLYAKELDNLMNNRKELINSKQKREEENE